MLTIYFIYINLYKSIVIRDFLLNKLRILSNNFFFNCFQINDTIIYVSFQYLSILHLYKNHIYEFFLRIKYTRDAKLVEKEWYHIRH